jgi:hypothetical protein
MFYPTEVVENQEPGVDVGHHGHHAHGSLKEVESR